MSVNAYPELKKAIVSLPQKEKDKLLIRLINKDKLLVKQLHFQLLENEEDLKARTEELEALLLQSFEKATNYIHDKPHPRNHKRLIAELRAYSGHINEYAYITKHLANEIQLRLLVLNRCFELYPQLFQQDYSGGNKKLLAYQANRIKYTWTKFLKLHEDLRFDFSDSMDQALHFAHCCALRPLLLAAGIPEKVD